MAENSLAFPKSAQAWGKPEPWGAPPLPPGLQVLGAPSGTEVRWERYVLPKGGERQDPLVRFLSSVCFYNEHT